MHDTHSTFARADSISIGNQRGKSIVTKGRFFRLIPALLAMTGLYGFGALAKAGTVVNVTFQGQDPNASSSGMGVRLHDSLKSTGTPNGSAVAAVSLNEGGAFDFKVNGMGATSAMLIEDLWGKYINTALNPPAGLTTSQAAGAFQLAVWKLEYDGKDPYGTPGSATFGKGCVEVSATNSSDAMILSRAGNSINSLSLNPSSGELSNLVAISGANYQDQVCQIVTPEPSSNLIWLVVATIGVYPICADGIARLEKSRARLAYYRSCKSTRTGR